MEFGEQIRQARERKGMTQQTLADALYVTRQAVSRWEHGERYPDLLTVKKISLILNVSLDQLLLNENPALIAERNPIAENRSVKNILIALYASISLCYFVNTVWTFMQIRTVSSFGSASNMIMASVRIVRWIVEMILFSLCCIWSCKERFNPRIAGITASIFWGMESQLNLSQGVIFNWQWLYLIIGFGEIIATISCYLFFVKNDRHSVWKTIIYISTALEILRELISFISVYAFSKDFLSLQMILSSLLTVGILVTIILQTKNLDQKRKIANEDIEKIRAES